MTASPVAPQQRHLRCQRRIGIVGRQNRVRRAAAADQCSQPTQIQREARGRSRAAERPAHAVVAPAASAIDHAAAVAGRESGKRGAGVVVVAAQVGQVDVDRVHAGVASATAASPAIASSACPTSGSAGSTPRAASIVARAGPYRPASARNASRDGRRQRAGQFVQRRESLSRSALKSSASLPSPEASSPAARASAR